LPSFSFDDAVHAEVSARCIDAAVDGLRADLVMLRAARALAALEEAKTITTRHVERVADAVLQHRRRESGREPQTAGDESRQSTMQSADNDVKDDRRGGSHSPTSPLPSSERDVRGEEDWGYLPPEPAGMSKVKGVIPLSAKKR
jgi:magnesium chelatase subunit I